MMNRLWQSEPPRLISPDQVQFCFASGRLTYDCKSCGAQCCRRNGFLANREAELPLLRSHRNLALFLNHDIVDSRRPDALISNCPPGCCFLTGEGLCKIHADHGRDAKPEACRLFPFNDFCCVGPYLVVSVHSWLCPLDVTPRDDCDEGSNHDRLVEDMSAKGITERIRRCEPPQEWSARDMISLEQAIVDSSERHLELSDYREFVATPTRPDDDASV